MFPYLLVGLFLGSCHCSTEGDTVSDPDISFKVLKENSNYFALVTCQSTRGTLPVSFSLYNRTELAFNTTVEARKVDFKVPLVLDKHLGWLQCRANNGDQVAHSRRLPLQVVRVGGPVMMHYNYEIGQNYAVIGLRFYCKATKGSHPRYRWFLNQTLLQGRGSFYHMVNQPPDQSILLLSVGSSSAGTYHCEVSDIFDNTTAISSQKQYIDKKVLNRLPVSAVAVVFGCFALLVVLVSGCCFVGLFFRRRESGEESPVSQETEKFAAYEDSLNLRLQAMSEYHEDSDVVRSARCDELDWLFAIVVFACITTEGYINPVHSAEPKCIFNQNDSACHYAVGIGVIAFLACVGFLLLDVYMPFMSNAQQRKYAVMADLGFSGTWTFLWFVCFCLLASQWGRTHDVSAIPQDAARATVAFSFFSIATWGILTYFAFSRFRSGGDDIAVPTYTEQPTDEHTPYPPTYAPASYNPTPYTPTTYSAYPDLSQQPAFTPNLQPTPGYQPPNY